MAEGAVPMLIAAILASAPMPAAGTWPVYRNQRFGYEICYPADLLKPEREADNGDGRRFSGSGGVRMLVFGQYNALDQDLASWAQGAAQVYLGKRGRVIYRAGRKDWAVISGTDGKGNIFYTRTIRDKANDAYVTYQLRYPDGRQQRYGPVIARLNRCFGLARGG